MTHAKAADLPDGSIVADADRAFIKNNPTPWAQWCVTNGAYLSDSQVEDALNAGATVVRVGASAPRNVTPFAPNTRVTFGPDNEPGTIIEVVMRRAEGISYVEPGTDSVVVEPGARVWEYDVRADSDGRLVSCQPREVKLLPVDLKAIQSELDGGAAGRGRILARRLAAELAYRLSEIEVLRGDVERLRAAVIDDDAPDGGQ